MNATITVGGPVEAAELVNLFSTVGWSKHADLDRAARILHASDVVVQARAGMRLIGFGRALTDGILYANIYDLVVDPEFHRQGIGSTILTAIMGELRAVRKISLNTATGAQEFYRKHGFETGHNYFERYQW